MTKKTHMAYRTLLVAGACLLALPADAAPQEAQDILIADFEGQDWGDWRTEGEAFGPFPAEGNFENQENVTGFEGKCLVNSFYKGDAPTGKVISPEFVIERDYIRFLVGGGLRSYYFTADPEYVGIKLVHKGSAVRVSPTNGHKVDGSETLRADFCDVGDLIGETVHLEIVDACSGRWGHILADDFYQTDRRVVPMPEYAEREVVFDKKWLNIPMHNGAHSRTMKIIIDGELVAANWIPIVASNPQRIVPVDLSAWAGKKAVIQLEKIDGNETAAEEMLKTVLTPTDKMSGDFYGQPNRPRVHFAPRFGYCGDSNGLVYYDGEYHLGYQINPLDLRGFGNIGWGHAISTDLVHWKEQPLFFWPDDRGAQWSGSTVADVNNKSSFQTGKYAPLVAFYTTCGVASPWTKRETATICIAYSNDRGRTWTKYEGNPIIRNIDRDNRDPKVFWYEPGGHYVMVLYIHDNVMHILTSDDLVNWSKQSESHGFHECPELFELPVDGDKNNKKWVIYGGDCRYKIGSFDGKRFTPETDHIRFFHTVNSSYASQVFNNVPNGRKIWIARVNTWVYGIIGMQTFPLDLTLQTVPGTDKIEVYKKPVPEIENLYDKHHKFPKEQRISEGKPLRSPVDSRALDIDLEITPSGAKLFAVRVYGRDILFDLKEMKARYHDSAAGGWNETPLTLVDGRLPIRILVDTNILELFTSGGRFFLPVRTQFSGDNRRVELRTEGGDVVIDRFDIHELKAFWEDVSPAADAGNKQPPMSTR